MRLKVIACNVLFREVCHWAARSPHTVDLSFLDRSLHDDPDDLRVALQSEIDSTTGAEAVVLGYGLCSNAGAYLRARDVPLVLPRAHDCITLFLGSKERYQESFAESPGTYYYTSGWIERAGARVERTSVGGQEANERIYREYVERFGEDNAKYLMDTLHSWWKTYSRAVFVEMGLPEAEQFEGAAREVTRKAAEDFGWECQVLSGDHRLFRALLSADWSEGDFLVAPPGAQIVPSYDGGVVTSIGEPQPIPPRAPRR